MQGFGNVGSVAARLLAEQGAKVVAVSDVSGGVTNQQGLGIDDLRAYWRENGQRVSGYPQGDAISNDDLLALPVDVLVLAALENQLRGDNADRVRARIIAEGANGPTTPEADAILADKGILTIPDVLCNAGGVTVSYFEWVQGLQAHFWSEDEVNHQLERIMTNAYQTVMNEARRSHVHTRMAAQTLAIRRVADATRLRGIFP